MVVEGEALWHERSEAAPAIGAGEAPTVAHLFRVVGADDEDLARGKFESPLDGLSEAAAALRRYREAVDDKLDAMPQALVETVVAIVSFLLGIPARVEFWSCLLCKTSHVLYS